MRRIILLAAVLACASAPGADAFAQSRGRAAPRAGGGDEDTLPPSVPPKVPTLSPNRGISGPRLEPGATLCSTEADLERRAEVGRRIAEGDANAGDPLAGCRLMNQERGVEVVARHGLGRVQVKVKPTGEVGWTDSYLR